MRTKLKQTSKSIRFIIPGLLDPVPYLDQLPAKELPELAVFSKMLSRGELLTPETFDARQDNFYHCLLKEMGNDKASTYHSTYHSSQSSIASLSYQLDVNNLSDPELFKEKWIMRADPSFLMADRDQLVLAQTGSLDISIDEANLLVDEINHFFDSYEEESFWTLKSISPDRWYIISDKPINIQSVPPENALGQSIKSFLFNNDKSTKGIDSNHWMSLFNEMQMILHQSEVNKKRTEAKKLPVNSLWFWGAGEAVDELNSLTDNAVLLYSDHPLAQNLSHLQCGKKFSVPEHFSEIFYADEIASPIIITIESFIQAIRSKDVFSWVGLLEQFESNYLIPIMDELNSGKILQVEFISPSGRKLLLTKKLLKRWWKKNKNYRLFLCTNSDSKN